jgi:hypothetical protein
MDFYIELQHAQLQFGSWINSRRWPGVFLEFFPSRSTFCYQAWDENIIVKAVTTIKRNKPISLIKPVILPSYAK